MQTRQILLRNISNLRNLNAIRTKITAQNLAFEDDPVICDLIAISIGDVKLRAIAADKFS